MLAEFSPSDRKIALITSGILVLLVGGWLVFGPYGLLRYYRVATELKELSVENQRLRRDNEAMRQEVVRLKNDPVYVSEVARRQFHFIHKNEVVYLLPEKKKRHE